MKHYSLDKGRTTFQGRAFSGVEVESVPHRPGDLLCPRGAATGERHYEDVLWLKPVGGVTYKDMSPRGRPLAQTCWRSDV